MNICILQHVPFEGAGTILPFFSDSNHHVRMVHLYDDDCLPSSNWPDLLIVMGGPMGAGDEDQFHWLEEEKRFIKAVIDADAWVLGVCLGAQLIADVLGASVTKNRSPEIGWFPVKLNSALQAKWLVDIFGSEIDAFHWHGDTFSIPEGAQSLGSSEACDNQGFLWGDRVLGLQFHLEFTAKSTALLTENCAQDLVDSEWVQTPEEMLSSERRFVGANMLMGDILHHINTEILDDVRLNSQLEGDCHLLSESDEFWFLLQRNAAIPWFILVPKGRFRDLDDLTDEHRVRLFKYADAISNLLREDFQAEKINVAALGNMVAQLHLHVIGRKSTDACWPNPVWGNLKEETPWADEDVEALKQRVVSMCCDKDTRV